MTKQNEQITECTRVRESYGFTQTDVARALGLSITSYSLTEKQTRKVSKDRSERLYYEIHHACTKLVEKQNNLAEDLEANTFTKETTGVFSDEEEIQEELNFKMHYKQLTEKLYQEILLKYIFKGKTVVNAAANTGVCESTLRRRLEKDGIPHEVGDNWENLV